MLSKKNTFIKAVIVSVILSLGISIVAYAAKTDEAAFDSSRQEVEEKSVQSYQILSSYLNEQKINNMNLLSMGVSSDKANLANVYAGAYIDKNGCLTVNVVDDSDNIKNEIKTAAKDDSVFVKKVQWSLEELNSTNTKLCSVIGEVPYHKISVSETDNTVKVYTESQVECEKFIESLFGNNSAVTVVVEKNNNMDCAAVYAGSGLTCPSVNGVGSVGFSCYKDLSSGTRVRGIITAAHVVGDLGSIVTMSSKEFGTVYSSRYGNTVDAAFIKMRSSILPPWWTLKAKLVGGASINAWGNSSYTPEGSSIRKVGGTSGQTYGTIVSNMATLYMPDATFYSLTETTATAYSGDSGGPVIATSNNQNVLVGIIKANDAIGHSYYCKINYIINELGITPMVE